MTEMPYISPKFTVDDIHRVREYHSKLVKDMTPDEKKKFYNDGARDFLKEWEEKKSKR